MLDDSCWSVEERRALQKFKERLQDLDLMGNPLLEERRLMNWLRARDLKIDAAENMLRRHLAWRKENNMDDIFIPGNVNKSMVDTTPYHIIGRDKSGNSITSILPSAMDFKKIIADNGKDSVLRAYYYMLEETYLDTIKNSGDSKILKRIVYVADLDGIRLKDYISTDVMDVLITMLKAIEANYPELLSKAYLINAPALYSAMWNMLKPFIPPKTNDKITILTNDPVKIRDCLRDLIGEDQMARKWGGTGFSTKIVEYNLNFCSNKTGELKSAQQVTIQPGKSYDVVFNVEHPKTIISWSFQIERHDIGFSLFHSPTADLYENDGKNQTGIIDYRKLQSKYIHSGSLACSSPGKYFLRFDNTYSRIRDKVLMYHVESHMPKREENYDNTTL